MSLLGGDLTTPQRVATWMASAPNLPSAILSQLVTSQSNLIHGKLNRARLYSQTFTSTFDGVGSAQIMLPDYPVTSIISVQQGQTLIPPSTTGTAGSLTAPAATSPGYGYRFIPWGGSLPGHNAMVELQNGFFWPGPQNVKITYVAGYLISGEAQTVPAVGPYVITVNQFQGIWCRDNGVVYSATGVALVPVAANPTVGQYVVGPDSTPGQYTFSAADAGAALLISYSFVPADLEEAVIQMVAERYAYRSRVGDISKSLGGQETMRFFRGNSGRPWSGMGSLPPEVYDLINPYISVLPPTIGAPV